MKYINRLIIFSAITILSAATPICAYIDPDPCDPPCPPGNALYFDGIDDYVECGDPADGSLDFGANESFSISAWIKCDKTYSAIACKRRCGGVGGVLGFFPLVLFLFLA